MTLARTGHRRLPAWPWILLGLTLPAVALGADGDVAAPSLDSVWSQLQLRAMGWLEMAPVWLVAVLVGLLSWWLGSALSRARWLPRVAGSNPFLHDVLRQLLRAVVVLLGLVLALEIAGASSVLGTVLGAAGVLGLAVSFALRDVVENYLASLLLSLRQPFAPADHVRIDDAEGRVVRLTARATILMTLDGNHLRVPNAQVFKARILNFTRNPKRRFEFDVGVGTDQPLGRAQAVAVRTLCATEGVLSDPAPACLVQTLSDSNVVLQCLGWMDQTGADFRRVRSDAIAAVKRAFDDEHIVMPEPIYSIRLDTPVVPAAGDAPSAPPPPPPPQSVAAARTSAVREVPPPAGPDPVLAQIADDRQRPGSADLLRGGTNPE